MPKYIIFLDDTLKGYLDDEDTVKKAICELASGLVSSLKENAEERVFQENVENGINIYSQSVGRYFNGPVYLRHKIEYRPLPEYRN